MVIAALYVKKGGPYYGLDGVDPWDEQRDARLYRGPYPVVAHPPCSRWCRLAGFVEKQFGYKRGEDGGCFEAALKAVRAWGGVLEHPAYSTAWAAFDLPVPSRSGGWQKGFCGGWSCHVEQGRYGHPAKKATWLYAFGVESLPTLQWGSVADAAQEGALSWWNLSKPEDDGRARLTATQRIATPQAFRDVLVEIARSASIPKHFVAP